MPDQAHQLARSVQRKRPRPALQLDSGFFRRPVALAVVAGIAARHQILPRRASAARARHHVVERQLGRRKHARRRIGRCSGRAEEYFSAKARGSAAEYAGSSKGESPDGTCIELWSGVHAGMIGLFGLRNALSISTKARRTAVTLIGSKVAFRTRTGACITEGRLAGEGIALVAAESGDTPTSAQYRPGS